ncbi:MAG: alpha/beta fold hydrolase [Parasphingopyxis sp.]|uniref:alpha/beta hydrolase n=1 Tax=Parasphingopyxis sp. TaxID=1920299 RepID=UPI0032ED28E9
MSTGPQEFRDDFGAGEICRFEWGDPSGQPILLLHATGFHARCWDQVVAHLPQDRRIVAVDLPGHGRSYKPDSLSDWVAVSDSIASLVDGLDLRSAIGVGHSMGGFCLVQLAAKMPDRFVRLVLVDPVLMPPEMYHAPRIWPYDDPSEHPVARRRDRFASSEEMAAHFKDRSPYNLWQPAVLEDYCRHGLLPAEDGDGYKLACPPRLEASMYMGSSGNNPYDAVAKIETLVTVLRAPQKPRGERMDFTNSPTWPKLADAFVHGRDVYLSQFTHFMPMEDPERIAMLIMED